MFNIEILDVKSNSNLNCYTIKNSYDNKIYTVSNFGDCLDLKNLCDYLNYCYRNYYNNVRGYKDFLSFEKEECNVWSLNKYKIYNYVGLCASNLIKIK